MLADIFGSTMHIADTGVERPIVPKLPKFFVAAVCLVASADVSVPARGILIWPGPRQNDHIVGLRVRDRSPRAEAKIRYCHIDNLCFGLHIIALHVFMD